MYPEREYTTEKQDWVAAHLDTISQSGTTESITARGAPVIVITVLGIKSGKLRKIPLIKVEHAGKYAIFSSNAGSPQHPAWYYSIRANPRIEIQDGTQKFSSYAYELFDDAEREIWWKRAANIYPYIIDFRHKTTRKIPIFILEPSKEDPLYPDSKNL